MSTDLTTTDRQEPDQGAVETARQWAEEWIEALDLAGDTRAAYKRGVEKFMAWLDQERSGAVTAQAIRRWRDSLAGSAATVNLYLSAVRRFYTWLEERAAKNGQVFVNPAANVSGLTRQATTKRHKRDELTVEEVKTVLETCHPHTLEGVRDRAILSLMACCALRTVEVHRADVGDLEARSERLILWIRGKGQPDKGDFAVLNSEAEEAVRRWLAVRPGQPDGPLFVSLSRRTAGGRLSRSAIRRMVKARYRLAGVIGDRKSTHSLRHSAISQVAQAGTLLQAQALARHADPKTTMIYYHDHDRLENPPEDLIDYG